MPGAMDRLVFCTGATKSFNLAGIMTGQVIIENAALRASNDLHLLVRVLLEMQSPERTCLRAESDVHLPDPADQTQIVELSLTPQTAEETAGVPDPVDVDDECAIDTGRRRFHAVNRAASEDRC